VGTVSEFMNSNVVGSFRQSFVCVTVRPGSPDPAAGGCANQQEGDLKGSPTGSALQSSKMPMSLCYL